MIGTTVDGYFRPSTAYNRCIFRIDDHFFSTAQIRDFYSIQCDTEILKNRLTTREHRQVAHDCLATIAVARSFHSHRLNDASQFIHHQCCERFAFNIFGNYHEGLSRFADGFKQRHKSLRTRYFFFKKKDVRIFKRAALRIRIRNKMRGQIASVKLHTLNHIDARLRLLAFLNGNYTVFANLQKSFAQNIADRRIIVSRNRCNLHQFLFIFLVDGGCHINDRFADGVHCFVNTTRKRHRIGSGSDHF